jgi:hypothetical protein
VNRWDPWGLQQAKPFVEIHEVWSTPIGGGKSHDSFIDGGVYYLTEEELCRQYGVDIFMLPCDSKRAAVTSIDRQADTTGSAARNQTDASRTCTEILSGAMGYPSIGSSAVGVTLGLFGTPLGGQVSVQLARSASGQQGILLTGAGGVSGGTSVGLAATVSAFSTSDLRRLEGWGIQGGSSGAISGSGPTVGAELVFGLDRLPSPGNSFTADPTFGGVDVNLGLGAGIEGHGMPSNSVIVPLLGPADICRLLFD